MSNESLVELLSKVDPETDASLLLWMQGEDLHYAWFGLTAEQTLLLLRRLIKNIQGGNATTLGPSPTKH